MVGKNSRMIVIRLDADHKRGLGHLFRMLTLARFFRHDGFECFFVVRHNETAEVIIKDAHYNFLFCPSDLNEEEIVDLFFDEYPNPALWIFDILSTDEKLIVKFKRKKIPVACFDDLLGGPAAADLTINAIAGCWNEIPAKTNVLGGPGYAIIDPAILGLRHKSKPPGAPKTVRVGITMGGSDTHGATVKVAKILSGLTNIEANFFLGPHFLYDEELNMTLKNVRYRYENHKAVTNLHKALRKMDIVICGGGQTLFELCAMGVPVIAIANETHEEKTIAFFARHGACLTAGSVQKTIAGDTICSFITKINNDPRTTVDLSQKSKILVDGKGITRCYQACLEIVISPLND
jgi:spore coat polysaccharide biosynthesis predicted glycosyltransferase SpsG